MTAISSFALVASEAGIASDQLAHGVALLDRGSFQEPETFTQAFFPLTIGLERSAKLAYAFDYRLAVGRFPNDAEFRKAGHRLNDLLTHLETEIVARRWPGIEEMHRPGLPIHTAVVDCLTSFAKSDGRYYNLASLGGRVDLVDPVKLWIESVVLPTYRDREPNGIDDHTFFNPANDAERTLAEYNIHTVTTPLVRLYVLQLIRWIAKAILRLHDLQRSDLPFMNDFFSRFERTDEYFMKHKTYPSRS